MNDVVASAIAQKMAQHAKAKAQRRTGAAVAVRSVQLVGPRHCDHVNAGYLRRIGRSPLAPRQIGDLVAIVGQSLGEVPVPALGAADGPREKAVVGDADPHACSLRPPCGHLDCR